MDVTWTVKYITEFIGTALLVILGNGAVANVKLKGTKGYKSGWVIITLGYGFGVMLPALMFGNVSGNHINPAFTLGLAISDLFPWKQVLPYILAQMLGAIFGQLIIVATHAPYYRQTESSDGILGTFSTISAVDDGTDASKKASLINGFLNEFAGSFVLFFGALALTKNYFGGEIVQQLNTMGTDVTSSTFKFSQVGLTVGANVNSGLAIAHLGLGFLVMALVASLGGPTGPALNPARDLGPRLLHHFLPESVLGKSKGNSKWWYSWVPVIAPILAGIAGVALFKYLYMK